ncbi:glycosyltransferase family 39 protein [Pseudomonas citrulli]|uniref:Glycosyltransferase family 39 protein n=1 Tax=Pseudomonas citrulli TaxID=3064347 RepID=A0ABT9C433_9PSED|nr:glycosyltransferase family 39 protein [Pseudomonas sp. K18]MDO7899572.1 glycosyltransferase family 39 protein [Pseudomonas sp. K18]
MKGFRPCPGKPSNWLVDRLALIALVFLALVVRFHGITVPAIWYDEAFSVLLAQYDLGQICSITARDLHPPFYYVVLHYWIILFGDSALAVRSLSVMADVGAVLLGIKLMSLVATRRATWIAALLLALLPISVRYSQEARMYTLLGFWLMGATVALVCWVKEPRKKRFPVIYVLLMSAAFYTHYFASLGVLVHWFYWWWGRSGNYQALLPARRWILANGAIMMLFVPWLPHFVDHVSQGPVWKPPVTAQGAVSLVWQFVVMNAWGAQSLLLRAIPLVLVVACAVALLRKDNGPYRFNGLLIGYFFVPAVVLASAALIVPAFAPRYLIFAAAGLPLIVAAALDRLLLRMDALVLALAVALTAEVQGLQSVYQQTDGINGTDARNDYRVDRLVAKIKQARRPNEEIVLESLIWYLPFIYYNESRDRIRLYVRTPLDDFWSGADRGGYGLIPESDKWIFFHDMQELKRKGSDVWWVMPTSVTDLRPLFEKDWERSMTLADAEMVASRYTLKAIAASTEAGDQTTLTPPLFPAPQNYPPAPSATSANRTGR